MSTERSVQDSAYVLHSYAYQETSLIVEAFTRAHGRVALMAKGARRPRSALRGTLLSFQPLRISWFGKSELHTLGQAEWQGGLAPLRGLAQLCGFYLNELLMKLLAREDPHEQLFEHYQQTLQSLSQTQRVDPCLRNFELQLLSELGYGLNLATTADTHAPVQAQARYGFSVQRGVLEQASENAALQLRGKSLLDMQQGDFDDPITAQESKQLMRLVIGHHLNGKTLHTRQLLRDLQQL